MRGLAGRTVIVTGGGQGIGETYARRLAQEGCRVVVAEVNEERGARVAKEIEDEGGEALAVPTDVAYPASVERLAAAAQDRFGSVDGLVNNAAIYFGLQMTPVTELAPEEWDRVMAVNVKGSFLCARAVAPLMQAQGSGRIVNVSSTVALAGPPMLAHYVTSKAAIIGLTRALARELGPSGIAVNAVAPGGTWTEASDQLSGGNQAVKDMTVASQSLKRPQVAEDVVGTVCFLLSEEAAMMSGQVIVVDGGSTFH